LNREGAGKKVSGVQDGHLEVEMGSSAKSGERRIAAEQERAFGKQLLLRAEPQLFDYFYLKRVDGRNAVTREGKQNEPGRF